MYGLAGDQINFWLLPIIDCLFGKKKCDSPKIGFILS